MTKGLKKKGAWTLVALWVALIYSTLYIARPISEFLKTYLPFNLLLTLGIITCVSLVVFFGYKKLGSIPKSKLIILAFIICGYALGLSTLRFPEEKLHLVQYGVLAFLIFKASKFDLGTKDSYIAAFFLCLLFGWLDEGIQYLLPNRVYDINDVVLNAVSGLLALGLVYVGERPNSNGATKSCGSTSTSCEILDN